MAEQAAVAQAISPSALPSADDWLASAKNGQVGDQSAQGTTQSLQETPQPAPAKQELPNADDWYAPVAKQAYDKTILPTMGRVIQNAGSAYLEQAQKDNKFKEAISPIGFLPYNAEKVADSFATGLKDLAIRIGSLEGGEPIKEQTPVADQLKAQAQKEGRNLNTDELKQIAAESGAQPLTPFAQMAFAPLAPLQPLFDGAMKEARDRGVSAGNIAVANTLLLATALAHVPHEVASEGLTNFTHASEPTFMGLKEPTPPEMQTATMAEQQLKEMNTVRDQRIEAQKGLVTTEPTSGLHDIMRRDNPELFANYDRLVPQVEAVRSAIHDPEILGKEYDDKLADLKSQQAESLKAPVGLEGEELGTAVRTANAHGAEIDAAIKDLGSRERYIEQGRKAAQTEFLQLDSQLRELSPQVNSARDRALPEAKETAFTVPAEAAPFTEKATETAAIAPKPTFDIAADFKKKLLVEGRTKEQAEAESKVVAARYETAATNGWTKGTAEEIYKKHIAAIKATKGAKEKVDVLNSLAQSKNGEILLASKNSGKAIIKLFKKNNASTLMHEMAHHWLDEMVTWEKQEGAPEGLKQHMGAVRKYLGEDKGEFSGFTSEQHEKWARGFERYLREGIAPSKELANAFAHFKQWLEKIYDTVKKLKGLAEISPEIRRVFDHMLVVKPERIAVAADHEPAKAIADIHDADVRNTPPEQSAKVADTVRDEIDITAKLHNPEIADAIKSAEQTTGSTATLTSDADAGAGTESPGRGQNTSEEPSAVAEGGNRVAPEGSGVGEPAEGAATAGGSTAKPLKPVNGATYIKDGWFRLDKFNFSDDAHAMIREMAAHNSDFMDARYGEPAYRLAKEVEAAQMLVQQTGTAMDEARIKFGDSGTVEDMIAYNRATDQAAMAFAADSTLKADLAHGFHQLQKQVTPLNVKNAAQAIMERTGKSLFQLQMEAKLMGGSGDRPMTPRELAKAAYVERANKLGKVNSLMLRIIYNSWLSNPITHLKYLTGIGITAVLKDIPQGAFEAMFSTLRGAEKGDKFYANEIGAGLYGTFHGVRDAYPAAADAVHNGLTFMEGYQLPGAINAVGHIFGTIKLPKGMTKEVTEMWRDAKNEAMEKGAFAKDIDPQLVMNKAAARTPEALANKAELPKIYAYLENAAKPQEYTSLGAKEPGEAFADMSAAGKLGYALTIPERAISGVHTLGYAMHYGQEIARRAYRSAVESDLKVGSDEFDTQVAKFTQQPPLKDIQESHEEAIKMLLMNRAKYGTFLYHIIQASRTNALAALIMPFAQLGSNLVHFAGEQTPFAYMFPEAREDLSGRNGGMAQDRARAKISTGTAISALVLGMAAEQLITPNWSTDPEQRKLQVQQGFKPHALKIGNLYIPLTKFLGGYGPLVGQMADFYNVGHLATHDQKEKASAALLASIATNLTDTAFSGGISNIVQAQQDPEHWDKYISNMAASVLPYSSLRSELTKWTDPYQRVAHGVLEDIKRGTPGLSNSLFPARDCFGEPIAGGGPASIAVGKPDPVSQWWQKLDFGPSPIPHYINGVKLTDQQYDDYSRIAGRTTKQLMQRAMSAGIQSAPPMQQLQQIKEAIDFAREKAAMYIKGQPGSNIMKDANNIKRGLKKR